MVSTPNIRYYVDTKINKLFLINLICTDREFVRAALRLAIGALRRVLRACDAWSAQAQFLSDATASCWDETSDVAADFSAEFTRFVLGVV